MIGSIGVVLSYLPSFNSVRIKHFKGDIRTLFFAIRSRNTEATMSTPADGVVRTTDKTSMVRGVTYPPVIACRKLDLKVGLKLNFCVGFPIT